MDTSAEQSVATDTLGRRTGPRRQYTLQEKRQIVQETHARGASVSLVARRHDLNPNQIFAWRRLYRQGLLKADAPENAVPMLPVKVSTPTVMPTERATRVRKEPSAVASDSCIEIRLANGNSVILHGHVDVKRLARVMGLLVRR